jgi:lipopolysaccharide/colanic/teichoic acid biosynthesis glycosyltransferase
MPLIGRISPTFSKNIREIRKIRAIRAGKVFHFRQLSTQELQSIKIIHNLYMLIVKIATFSTNSQPGGRILGMFPTGIPIAKRLFDLLLTSLGLVIGAPSLLLAATLVRIYHGRPVIFTQKRPGYKGTSFHIYKFRTMNEMRDPNGNLRPDAERLTRLGRFLRSTSLDELPELFNILRGEMSLVGPRPLLMQYLERYSPEQARRHDVLPGLTGWAQVNGRNALTWDDKFKLDVWYVDNWSLWLDIKILFLTIWKVFKREGISQPGHATAEEFMGHGPRVE